MVKAHVPKPKKRPGRPPKWKQGITPKYYKMPIDLEAKLKRLVQEGKFESEVEAIYHYVMYADKLDELFERIKRLEEQLELKDKEIEALRARVKVLESEKEEFVRKYHELLKEHEGVVKELMRLKAGFGAQNENEKEGVEVVGHEKDLWSLTKRYLELRDKKLRTLSDRELMKLEEEQKKIQREINAILDSLGIVKLSFWRTLNQKGLDEVKRLVGG